ncbi:hypothetical protein J6590_083060 [Homalodisca vitripennis]|nr:hypothetical protein J6590_083060 [Homalodisca vitripennis]
MLIVLRNMTREDPVTENRVVRVGNYRFTGKTLGKGSFATVEEAVHIRLKVKWVRRSSQDNHIKQRRAWLLLGWVTAERSCPSKQPACPAIGGGSEVTFKPFVPRLSVIEGFFVLTSPDKVRHPYFTLL